jgi:hypothetical protein
VQQDPGDASDAVQAKGSLHGTLSHSATTKKKQLHKTLLLMGLTPSFDG